MPVNKGAGHVGYGLLSCRPNPCLQMVCSASILAQWSRRRWGIKSLSAAVAFGRSTFCISAFLHYYGVPPPAYFDGPLMLHRAIDNNGLKLSTKHCVSRVIKQEKESIH